MVNFKNNQYETISNYLKVGDKAPNFNLINESLENVSLDDFANKIKVLSIIPSINTGVCDAQTKHFNQKYQNNENLAIISISMDLPFAFKNYCANENLQNAICLSDHRDAEFGTKYGVLIPKLRLLQRAVMIIDQNNIVQYAEYVEETSNPVNFQKLEEILQKLIKT